MTIYPLCYYIVKFADNSEMNFSATCGLDLPAILQYIKAYGIELDKTTFTIFEYLGTELKRVIPKGLK